MKIEKQSCPYCDETFWSFRDLDRHIYSYHQDQPEDAHIECPAFSE